MFLPLHPFPHLFFFLCEDPLSVMEVLMLFSKALFIDLACVVVLLSLDS
jgi:hypothetical protein